MTVQNGSDLAWVPDACTLPTAEQPLRLAEFDALFTAAARDAERLTQQHLRVTLFGGSDLADSVRDLAGPRSWPSATARWGSGPALREVFPETREQRDWVHKTANVLAALPKSAHPGAKAALAEICNAEDKRHAKAAAKKFAAAYGAKLARRPRRSPTIWACC